jgi:hypothetical protein
MTCGNLRRAEFNEALFEIEFLMDEFIEKT